MYFLSVFAVFKNESHIIDEWIRHYIDEGVDHFYLIDNGSTDNYMEKLKPYMDKVTLFSDPSKQSQTPMYNKYILPRIHETEWIIGCDLDEFLWGTDKKSIKNVLEKETDDNIGLIRIPWEQFGSNGHIKQPDSVISSFTKRRAGNHVIEVKYIARSSAVVEFGVHICTIRDGYSVVDSTFTRTTEHSHYTEITEDVIKNAKIRLAHYQIQSLDWFTNVKMTRGDVAFETNPRNYEYFKSRDFDDVSDDTLARKRSRTLKWKWFVVVLFIFVAYLMYKRSVI